MIVPKWVQIALDEVGECEVPGRGDNPRILEYEQAVDISDQDLHDATPWCSAFANWCVQQTKIADTQQHYYGTGSAWAQNWKSWGKEVDPPVPGCIVVFRHANGAGHVGFYLGTNDNGTIRVLGGNQSDSVCIKNFYTDEVIAYRMPNTLPEMVEIEDA